MARDLGDLQLALGILSGPDGADGDVAPVPLGTRRRRRVRDLRLAVAPALPGKVAMLKDYLSPSAPWLPFRETSFPDYLDSFPPTSVNAGMLVGHNTLRLMVMGMAERPPRA